MVGIGGVDEGEDEEGDNKSREREKKKEKEERKEKKKLACVLHYHVWFTSVKPPLKLLAKYK
jgi:hypothetical protein